MNFKLFSSIGVGLLLSCATFMSLAQAKDYKSNNNIQASQIKIATQYQAVDGSIINRPLIKMVPDATSSFTLGKEMVQFGGDYDSNKHLVPTGLSIYGRPYSNYNAGCTLCVFSSAGGMSGGSGQAAISGKDYRGGATAISRNDMTTVGFYHFDENSSARVVAQAASFGSGVVNLSSPMTNAEMSQLHVGMYVATNVIDPTIVSKGDFIRPKRYWGFIKSWDANHIYVYDWAVPGKNDKSDGQIPDMNYLDNQLSEYKVPMIFVGVPNGVMAENEFLTADGTKVLGNKATAVANSFQREEFDFRAHDWTKPKSLLFHGWVTSFECRPNCDPNALAEDSFAYLVNGPDGLPKAYVAQMGGDALEFSGFSTFIGGNGPPLSFDVKGNSTDSVVPGSNHIMSSFASRVPGGHILHMSTIVNTEVAGAKNWSDYGVRLVMDVDSQRDRKKGLYKGSRMGSIAFNYNGAHYGGVCLLGSDSNQGLCQEGDGSVSFAKQIYAEENAFFHKRIFTASASYDPAQKSVNGQGTMQTWNEYYPGNAHTEFTNIDSTNAYGGFDFYNIHTASSIENAQPLVRFGIRDTFFNIYPTMKQGLSISASKKILFKNNDDSKGVYLTLDSSNYTSDDQAAGKPDTRGDLLIGSELADGANIRGVSGYYGKSLTVTQQVSATKFHEQLSTPSSSSEACSAGDFKDDANYHYVCVAANKWKRVALSDF
ncbi:unnamed protein product [Commensalibacter communis]|uniref:hypothetical protein n=1 Tax=Commensalibacter communis TaxID=2972786 RepID=UPI0022FF8D8F|nr:hypothetical protein [Commensalibacter communis]CAI3956131.1 unnamed protein product [Commensalibacter communis]CAI3956917.1 unnamed protein product [Commensalibacter communis]